MKSHDIAPFVPPLKSLALACILAAECYASLRMWHHFNYGDLSALQLMCNAMALALAIGAATGLLFPTRSRAYLALGITSMALLLLGANEVMPLLEVLVDLPLAMWLNPWGWFMVLAFLGLIIGMTIGVGIALLTGLLVGKAYAHGTWYAWANN